MNQISDVLLYSHSNSYRNNSNSSIAIDSVMEDKIVDSYADIIDPNYRAWFIKRLKEVGKERFIDCGDRARKYGRNPQSLFTHLLK